MAGSHPTVGRIPEARNIDREAGGLDVKTFGSRKLGLNEWAPE